MSNPVLEQVRSEALKLNDDERAELAHDLVASLDGEADRNVAHDWDAEVARRLDEVDAGTARLIDREEFSRRLRERLNRP
jgi:putative addiction module component (TIGR02574 family)